MSNNSDQAAVQAAQHAIATILKDLETTIGGVVDALTIEENDVTGADDTVKRTKRKVIITARKQGSRAWVTGGA